MTRRSRFPRVPYWFLAFLWLATAGRSESEAANNAEIQVGASAVPTSMAPGSTAPVRIRVRNIGTTTWTAGTFYRLGALPSGSFNQVTWSGFNCGGYMIGATNGRAFLCNNVPPGATYDFRFNVTVPAGASGGVRLGVRMVRDGVEWFGASHAWTIGVASSGLPDVVVDSVSVVPANPTAGQPVTFRSVVRNVGSAPTPSGVVIGVGYRVDGSQKSWGVVNGPLAPGASVTIGTQGGTWTATSGTHTLTAVVDDVNRFAESNENNNARSSSFTVGSSGLPDVVVDSVSVVPANPTAGQAVTFRSVVRNIGSAPTPSGVVIGVGYRVDGSQKSWGVVNGPLAPGASVTIGTQGGSWSATGGAHTLTAVVDDVNRFAESNEGNNARSVTFSVSGGPSPTGPPWIFGMHDPGAEGEMEARGKRGWIVFTEAIGSNPNDTSGRDYRPWSSKGHGVIVRLNHGYEGAGNLPFESQYPNFATRVANFIQNSPGADIWILGNETNLPREWPGNHNGDPNTGEAITPQRYINCFNQVYARLQQRGLTNEILVPAPTGTWAPPYNGTIPGLPNRGVPGFLDYWVQVLNALGPTKVKGLAIHAYTHGGNGSAPINPNLVFSEQKMGPPYQNIYYHFRVYKNFMWAIPGNMRTLPVWITEANEFRELSGYNWDPHPNTIQWILNVYAEVNAWNSQASNQKIRTVALFRWPNVWEGDRNYCVSCVGSAVEGFRQVLTRNYRW